MISPVHLILKLSPHLGLPSGLCGNWLLYMEKGKMCERYENAGIFLSPPRCSIFNDYGVINLLQRKRICVI
jgi:hypothetical protein